MCCALPRLGPPTVGKACCGVTGCGVCMHLLKDIPGSCEKDCLGVTLDSRGSRCLKGGGCLRSPLLDHGGCAGLFRPTSSSLACVVMGWPRSLLECPDSHISLDLRQCSWQVHPMVRLPWEPQMHLRRSCQQPRCLSCVPLHVFP